MATMNRSSQVNQLVPGVHALFGTEYRLKDRCHATIFSVNKTERAWEEEVALAGFGSASEKMEGGGVAFAEAAEAWKTRYVVSTYALAYSITEEAWEDNLYESLSTRYTKMLAHAMYYAKELVCADVPNRAFTAGYVGGDGKTLGATDHPLRYGGTLSNRPATTADLNETSLEAAYTAIAGWRDEAGLLIAARPLRLVHHQANTWAAARLLNSAGRPESADNDINPIKHTGFLPKGAYEYRFLTDPRMWFVQTDVPDGLKLFQRKAVATNTDGDFNTGDILVRARERYVAGFSDYRAVYIVPGS